MSRSIKKHPFISICIHDSNKEHSIHLKEVSDVWNFSSDSLAYYISRKDYEQLNNYYNKLFRK